MQHDLVLTGFRLNAGEPPAKVLERVLGLDAQKARAATQRFPVILVRTSRERADQLAAALREAGAMVDVRESPTATAKAATSGQDAPPTPTSTPAQAAPATPPLPPAMPSPPATRTLLGGLPPLPPVVPQGAGLAVATSPLSAQATAQVTPAPIPETERELSAIFAAVQPANDATASPGTESETTAQANGNSSYRIGDLDLAFKPKTPVPTPMLAQESLQTSSLELDTPAPAPLGLDQSAPAPLELEKSAPAPLSLDQFAPALPLEPTQIPSSAPATAAQPEVPAFGGMQTFGDGFDDMDASQAPALELDRDASWLKNQAQASRATASTASATPTSEAHAASSSSSAAAEAPYRPQMRVSAPQVAYPSLRRRRLFERALELLRSFVLHALALSVVSLITAVAVGYARSPDALVELMGLANGPPPPAELKVPTVRPWLLPSLVHDPLMHPLLRLLPAQLTTDIARVLRAQVKDVHTVEVTWPDRELIPARDIECLLVEHQPGDKQGSEARLRVHELLRTGFSLEIPPRVRVDLGRWAADKRDDQGLKKRFTALCLAL